MELKFFPRDVIGKRQPKKAGDKFKAKFLTGTASFVVTSFHGDFFMAEIA